MENRIVMTAIKGFLQAKAIIIAAPVFFDFYWKSE